MSLGEEGLGGLPFNPPPQISDFFFFNSDLKPAGLQENHEALQGFPRDGEASRGHWDWETPPEGALRNCAPYSSSGEEPGKASASRVLVGLLRAGSSQDGNAGPAEGRQG